MAKAQAPKKPGTKGKAAAKKPAAKPSRTSAPRAKSKPTARQAKQRANAAKAKAAKAAKAQERGLTEQQEMFCREYIIDLNGTKAAIRAGYSAHSAAQQAARLLTNVKVSQRIADLKKRRADLLDIDGREVLHHLAGILRTNVTDVVSWDADGLQPIASADLLPFQARAIKSISMTQETELLDKDNPEGGERIIKKFKIDMNDPQRAAQLLGQHLNLWNAKNNGLPKRAVLFNFGTNQQAQAKGDDDA